MSNDPLGLFEEEDKDPLGLFQDAPEGMSDKLLGAAEVVGGMLSGIPGYIGGGLAGAATTALTGDPEAGAYVSQEVSDYRYHPKTDAGKRYEENIGKAIDWTKQRVGDIYGPMAADYMPTDPTAEAKVRFMTDVGTESAINFAPVPGAKAAGKIRKGKEAKINADVEAVKARQAEIDAAKAKPEAAADPLGLADELRQMELLEPDNQGKAANPYEAQHGTWAVDENGIPVRTDISMEAANLENPLQRNLWGDELPPRETPRGQAEGLPMDRDIMGHEQLTAKDVSPEQIGITQAMDKTRKGAFEATELPEAMKHWEDMQRQVQMLTDEVKALPELQRAAMDSETMTPRSKFTDPTINPIRRRSPGGRQTGGVNPEMFKDTFEAIKRFGDYTMKLVGNEYGGPTVVLLDKAGKEIGELRTQAKWKGENRNLEADFVKVAHEHRGKGLAKEMYRFLAENGNDIRRSDNLLDDGKKMWNKFEEQGFANDGMVNAKTTAEAKLRETLRQDAKTHIGRLAQPAYIPLKQRGAVGNLNPGKKANTILDDLRDRFAKDKDLVPDNPDPNKVVADALEEGKDSKQWNLTESGATLAAMKRKSALVQGVSRIVQNATKKAELLERKNVHPTERAFRDLSKGEITSLAQIMKMEMLQGKRFDADALQHLTVKQQEAYAHMRHMFDDTLRIQNEARAAKGQPPITEMEAYMSSRWSGDFRRPVYQAVLDKAGNPVIDAEGNIQKKLVYYLAAHSKKGLEKQWKALHSQFPDLTYDTAKDHTVRYYKRQTDLQSQLTTILDILGRNDPAVDKIRLAIMEQSVNEAATFLGQEKHFKEKAGVRGFVGDRPDTAGPLTKMARSAGLAKEHSLKEALAMFEQQIQYAKNAYRWSEIQKASQDLKTILSDPDLAKQQPNNVAYAKQYVKQNIGYGEAVAIAHIEDAIRNFGVSPTVIDKAVGDVKSFFILQKLAVNSGYTIANLLQTANVLPHLMLMRGQGIPGNLLTALPIGISGGIAMALGHYANFFAKGKITDNIRAHGPEANFLQKAFRYAEDNGVTARALYDEAPISTSFSKIGQVGNALGKTMSVSEAFVRGMAYMTYVEFLRSSKKFKNDIDLFQKAEELTNASMVDYRRGERPMVFEKLGTTGNFLNTLQTYPVNWYNQWNLFGREAMKGNVGPFLAALMLQYTVAGAMGIPGFEDMTKLWDLIKDNVLSDTTYAKYRDNDWFTDPKMAMVKHFGQPSVYGVLSDESGIGLTSRVAAPGAGQMLQSPGGPALDIGKQLSNLGSAITDPTNTTKWAQVAMSSSPPGVQGLIETSPMMEGTMWDKRGDGQRIYGRPGDVASRTGVVTRIPEEDTIRKFGLRSQRETVERELGYRFDKNKRTAEQRAKSIPDAFYDAVRRGDKNRAMDLYGAYVKLTGNEISDEAWNAQVKQNFMTTVERAGDAAESITALQDVARMNAILKEIKDEYKSGR